MMKKFLTKSIIAAGIASCVASAYANSLEDLKFYAGVGVDYNMYSIPSKVKERIDCKTKGLGFTAPVLGVKFHESFGVEAGYSFNKKMTSRKGPDVALKVRSMYLDLVGYMPVAEQFNLLGGLGIGKISAKGIAVTESGKASKTSWRAKIGGQYEVLNNLALRAIFSYHKGKESKINIKNIKNIGLYAIYMF